ncbi:MAG: tetratricopeptide repeat protein [Myxococcales bacterium]|nr:tetratricopeptide repeat protein [Myxococcales bacterium]
MSETTRDGGGAMTETATHETATHETATHETATHETATHETATHETTTREATTRETTTRETTTRETTTRETTTRETATHETTRTSAVEGEVSVTTAATKATIPTLEAIDALVREERWAEARAALPLAARALAPQLDDHALRHVAPDEIPTKSWAVSTPRASGEGEQEGSSSSTPWGSSKPWGATAPADAGSGVPPDGTSSPDAAGDDTSVDGAPSGRASDDAARLALEVRRAELELDDRATPVDEVLLALEPALAAARGATPHDLLARAHAARVAAYVKRRCRPLAEAALAEARGLASHPAIELAAGDLALAFDDRDEARACYERAHALDADAAPARLALANLHYVLGDFAACARWLEPLTHVSGADGARAWRLLAASHAARDAHEAEAEAWHRVIVCAPSSDARLHDRLSLALAHAKGGERAAALEALRAVWRDDPESPAGRYARARVEHLERSPDAPSRRLPAFPTTAQRWNYCGPAVLELCFRYLAIEMRQEEIADAVKREHGTPMFEIAAFLRRHGLVARRIAATPERLRAAIDLGVPVIVQEEYSTTSHVAVITGYDSALGVFFAADPATHRPTIKPFEWTERAGDLFGNGGLVVLGRDDDAETQARCAAADAAGLVDEPHLELLDRASELRPRVSGGDGHEEAAAEEVIQLCDEALAIDASFKLAWHHRTWARLDLYARHRSPASQGALLTDLYLVRSRFPQDEWPHQLHGRFLHEERRYYEAFVAYFEAWRRDPDDARDLEGMGEAMWLAGNLEAAEKYLLDAIAAEPHHPRAIETLAGVYTRQLLDVDGSGDDADADGDEAALDDIGAILPPRAIDEPVRRSAAELARRARHASRVALATSPDNPYVLEIAGLLDAYEGDHDAAERAFRRSLERDAGRPWAPVLLARSLGALGRGPEAEAVLRAALERHPGSTDIALALAKRLQADERHAEAAELLAELLHGPTRDPAALVEPFFRACARADTREAAAARVREVAEARAGDTELVRHAASLLQRMNQRGHAIALYRVLLDVAPGDLVSQYQLGKLLSEDHLTRDEAHALLRRVIELAPDFPHPRVALAWGLVGVDDAAGLALLEPVRHVQDAGVYDVEAALLESLGKHEDAERSLRHAVAAYGDLGVGLIQLCWKHIDESRYERAALLAEKLDAAGVRGDLRTHAESAWLTAHRFAGRARLILPRVREMCRDRVPKHLAWEIYWAMRSLDDALAAQAALVQAESEDDPRERLEWRINAAGGLARIGQPTLLEELATELGPDAGAWANLSWAYAKASRYGEANAAAERAYQLDPRNREALTAMGEVHVRRGDVDAAIAVAQTLLDLHPYEHQGAERLGILHGMRFDVGPALDFSLRAIDAAPFCHISQRSRAVALVAAGDLDGALRHAERAVGLEAPDPDDPGDDEAIRLALTGDATGLEACFTAQARHGHADAFPEWRARLRELATR